MEGLVAHYTLVMSLLILKYKSGLFLKVSGVLRVLSDGASRERWPCGVCM